MPEGPELHMTSLFINRVCKGRIFSKIHKSDISKNPVVTPPAERFTIGATSRGKEIKLMLLPCVSNGVSKPLKANLDSFKPLNITFTFGLAGKFEFYEADDLMKHAHLNFYTADQHQNMVLSFVDYMRFGKWTPSEDFAYKDRGPCVLTDYKLFRENVLQNLSASAFNKPICEALLNQRYFNGIGNYLRAEILFRLKVPPFVSARSVLEPLAEQNESGVVVKSEQPDILQLCNILPNEVVQLEGSWYDSNDRVETSNNFNNWLQCYYRDGMKNVADHNKRTIWYTGPLGPLAPKETIVRGKKKGKSRANRGESSTEEDESKAKSKKATKRTSKQHGESSSSKPKKVKKEEGDETLTSPSPSPKKRVTRSRVKKEVAVKAEKGTARVKQEVAVKAEKKSARVKANQVKTDIESVAHEETIVNGDMGMASSAGKQTRQRRSRRK